MKKEKKITEKKSITLIYTLLLSIYLVVTKENENDIFGKIGLVTLIISTTYLVCISTNVCIRKLIEKTNLLNKATP